MSEKLKTIPVPLLPTMVGACTLGNVFMGLGCIWIRQIIFVLAMLAVILYIGKIITNPDACKKEYSQVIPASLYAGFSMLLMLFGSFWYDFVPALGMGLWLIGVIIHAVHILIFTWKNVLHGVKWETFMPSWFVTYNGIMVSCVTGPAMNAPALLLKIILWYGIGVFTLILPFMIRRLITKPIGDGVFHTQAVLLAPCSLCVVSYLNLSQNPNTVILYYLYCAVILALLFIVWRLPAFFSYSFTPGFAGMTFPMAIGVVASGKFAGYLNGREMASAAGIFTQIQGIQIFLTTGIIFFVLLNFFILLKKNFTEK